MLALVFMPANGSACTGVNNRSIAGMRSHGCCGNVPGQMDNEVGKGSGCLVNQDGCCNQAYPQYQGQENQSHQHNCTHGCHCALVLISPLFLFAKTSFYIPLAYHVQEGVVLPPLRLPAGFDFIWRPPKIRNEQIG